MYEPVVTFSINESDAITAVSNNLREETYKWFKITKEIEVIYNFVDMGRFDKKPIDAFKKVIAPNGEKIIIHASNFKRLKGGGIIQTFAGIHPKVPSKLLMVGDRRENMPMETMVKDLNLCMMMPSW